MDSPNAQATWHERSFRYCEFFELLEMENKFKRSFYLTNEAEVNLIERNACVKKPKLTSHVKQQFLYPCDEDEREMEVECEQEMVVWRQKQQQQHVRSISGRRNSRDGSPSLSGNGTQIVQCNRSASNEAIENDTNAIYSNLTPSQFPFCMDFNLSAHYLLPNPQQLDIFAVSTPEPTMCFALPQFYHNMFNLLSYCSVCKAWGECVSAIIVQYYNRYFPTGRSASSVDVDSSSTSPNSPIPWSRACKLEDEIDVGPRLKFPRLNMMLAAIVSRKEHAMRDWQRVCLCDVKIVSAKKPVLSSS
jgi:hypothetical protein